MSALLEVQDLAFVSRTAREIEDVTFTLERGRCLCVAGDSGSGKTLLVRLLSGLERASEGRLAYDGVNMRHAGEGHWRALRRDMGVVLDNAGLLGQLTVAENIVYPLLARGEDQEQITPALEFALAVFDLYAWRGAYPRDLPTGLLRRTLLARATIAGPMILLCDNLFDGLSGQARADVRETLARTVKARNMALLFTTGSEADAALLEADIVRLA